MTGQPLADFTGTDVLRVAADLAAARKPFVLGLVVEARGSTSAHPGAKAVLDAEGSVVAGWVGGGCAESTIAHAALECLQTGSPQVVDVDLDDEVLGAGMPCGGWMRVYVEPVLPRPVLWILGHGRVAECLCHLGAMVGLDVVVDDAMAVAERYPDARRVIVDDHDYAAGAGCGRAGDRGRGDAVAADRHPPCGRPGRGLRPQRSGVAGDLAGRQHARGHADPRAAGSR